MGYIKGTTAKWFEFCLCVPYIIDDERRVLWLHQKKERRKKARPIRKKRIQNLKPERKNKRTEC